MPRTPSSSGAPEYWRRLVGLFFVGWVLIYANRTVLSPLLPVIQEQWGLSKAQLGLLNSAFFLMYTLMQVPTGVLADRFGRRRLLLPGYLVHGLGAAVSGIAGGHGAFLAARAATGLGQSTYYATQYALASEVIPGPFRALGMAIINSGMAFGIALGMSIASASLLVGGGAWRWAFVVLGGLTIVLWAVMVRLIRPEAGGVGPAPRPDPRAASGIQPSARAGPNGNVLLAYVVAFATMYGFFVILTWLPYYLQTQRGLAGAQAGVVSAAVAFTAVPAGVFAGGLSDRLGRRRPVLIALIPLSALALVMIVVSPGMPGVYMAIALYGLTGKLVLDPLVVALVADATPAASYGTAFGLLNFSGTISTVLAPAVTGYIADVSGTFVSAFLLAAALQVIATGCLLAMRAEPARGPGRAGKQAA
ncbi:MAG: MFS transporter [Bacillota bacterium]|nr:MFS transporter [Bacillota bacterium]